MNIPAAALPVPLVPANTAPDRLDGLGAPGDWNGRELVEVTVDIKTPRGDGTGTNTFSDVSSYQASAPLRGGYPFDRVLERPLANPADQHRQDIVFTKVGNDFDEAVRAANHTAKMPSPVAATASNPSDHAQAVLQADDGSYYITSLAKGGTSMRMNPRAAAANGEAILKDVAPLIRAVRAVVDRDEWIDFSNSGADIKFD